MTKIFVGNVSEFEERSRKIIAYERGELGVYRLDGQFYAYHNNCVHAGGPICQGKLFNRVDEPVADDRTVDMMRYVPGEVNLVCPWHGHEYDLKTGINVGNSKLRLRKIKLEVEEDKIYAVP